MKLVQKPEGYELRDRRSDKSGDGAKWDANDALYSASQEIAKHDVEGLFVCWRQTFPDGSTQTHFRFAGNRGIGESLLMSAMGRFMGWQK